MNTKESISLTGQQYIHISNRVMDIAIQRGIEMGVRAAVEYIDDEKKALRKNRHDKRLRNTRLLLKNYRTLKIHVYEAIFDAKQAKENAIDILDGLEEISEDDKLYIESIKRSQQRTLIILHHIDEMLKYYRIICEESNKPEEIRRYRVIMATYIDDEKKSAQEIGAILNIDSRTVYKDIKAAIEPVSSLIFGIDSLKLL